MSKIGLVALYLKVIAKTLDENRDPQLVDKC